jgi:Protein of unknown function (DUF998)
MSIYAILSIIGAASLLICIVCLVTLHFLPTGFHPIPDPVSNYGVSSYRVLYRIQAFSSGIAGACLLLIITRSGTVMPVFGIITLLCFTLSRMIIIAFPTDVKLPRTRTGMIHILLATLTFAGIACAAGSLTRSLAMLPIWTSVRSELWITTRLIEGSVIAFVFALGFPPLRKITGLIERCIYLGTLAWLGILYTQLLFAI